MSELDVVTGAFSYIGRHIAEDLLGRDRSVRTLTRRPQPTHPLAPRVDVAPLLFDDSLVESLRGADTPYNTYWARFERGEPLSALLLRTPVSSSRQPRAQAFAGSFT